MLSKNWLHFGYNISIHVKAAGKGREWLNARGWCCFTTRGETRADALATCLYESARAWLPEMLLRTDNTDGDPDMEKDFYILRHTHCPAVLTENLFMDNRDDVAFLESEEGSQAIIDLHVEGIPPLSLVIAQKPYEKPRHSIWTVGAYSFR